MSRDIFNQNRLLRAPSPSPGVPRQPRAVCWGVMLRGPRGLGSPMVSRAAPQPSAWAPCSGGQGPRGSRGQQGLAPWPVLPHPGAGDVGWPGPARTRLAVGDPHLCFGQKPEHRGLRDSTSCPVGRTPVPTTTRSDSVSVLRWDCAGTGTGSTGHYGSAGRCSVHWYFPCNPTDFFS